MVYYDGERKGGLEKKTKRESKTGNKWMITERKGGMEG